jgi:hypothetical protein
VPDERDRDVGGGVRPGFIEGGVRRIVQILAVFAVDAGHTWCPGRRHDTGDDEVVTP